MVTLTAGKSPAPGNDPDTSFRQAVSVKYELPEELKGAQLKKLAVDYNGIVYLLTDKGLYRAYETKVAKDLRYTPLSGRIPLDIAVQEGTGHLYYLYGNQFLTNGYAGAPYGMLPEGKYSRLAVASDGKVLLAGEREVAVVENGRLREIGQTMEALISVHVYKGAFYGLTAAAVYRFSGGAINRIHEGEELRAIAFREKEAVLGTDSGYYGIGLSPGSPVFPLQNRVPVPQITALLSVNNVLWAGTPLGVFMEEPAISGSPGTVAAPGLTAAPRQTDTAGSGAPRRQYRYYASKRWLDQDRVTGLAAGPEGNVFVLTPTGLNEIRFITQTLAEKAAFFQHKIRQRHIRYGLIANLNLRIPGDKTTSEMVDTDNDGLWSAFYLGSQAFRYAVTGEAKAKRYAWEAFEAYERLLSVNQLKGFPSRTFERKGFRHSDPERWRDSPDPEWEWKGHTSSDEFVAYIFVSAVLDQLAAETGEEKARVATFIDKILTHIIENDYYLVDIDGKPTMWGRWNPEYINWYPKTIGDRKLGSETIIAGLQLGYALTGKELYKTEAVRLMEEHGYLENILIDLNDIQPTPGYVYMGKDMGMGGWNHSDDEMAFLTYWVLYHYALDDDLREKFSRAIHNRWEIELSERNALWNMITLGTEGSFDKASAFWHLREFPVDLVRWNVRNSHRKDIVLLAPNFRGQSTEELLPPGERMIHRHNANPFKLDGGEGGKSELAGDEFLLPYWMGRYLEVIDAAETF
ncbi:hypothetical protein [Anseongella ginsenosidimutans]|nr:hypothetical protein [Anseongella ginsenosidimutans]QEC52769.1 hypothetical protein FRZ59_10755 [Anseongella ginsenosidimutans]